MAENPPQREDTEVIGARVAAQIIDLILMFVVFLFVIFVLAFIGGFVSGLTGTPGDSLIDAFTGIGLLVGGLATLGYSFFLEAVWDGQTIGKRLVGIRVVTESGERVTAGKAFLRNVPAIVSLSWLAYLVALLSMAATDRRQRLFDTLAGTVVVREGYSQDTPTPDSTTADPQR